MGQILSNLFFDVVLLNCQKLERDQLMKSRFSFTALDAYFVHKTVSTVLFQYFLKWHRSSQTSASFHWQPEVPVQKEGNGSSLVPGILKTQRRPQEQLMPVSKQDKNWQEPKIGFRN